MKTPDEIGENMTNRNAKNRGENSKDNRSAQTLCIGGITMNFSHMNKYKSLILRRFLGLTMLFWGSEKWIISRLVVVN